MPQSAARSRRGAPKPEDFTEQVRRCARCCVEKPLDDEHFRPSSAGRVYGLGHVCRACFNLAQQIRRGRPIDEDHDRATRGDLKAGIWTGRDLEPRGDVPIMRDWDLSCGMCGKLWPIRLTDGQAYALAARIQVQHIRCNRCHGWLSLSKGFTSITEATEPRPEPGDSLEGPRYVNPGHFKGSAA